MAAHFQEEQHVPKECGNCGCTEDLALCSRCHSIHFCSRKCQRAYWPFHKEWCRQNDFADHTEKTEPKFAKWMRKHGKMAVLKDGACARTAGRGRGQATLREVYVWGGCKCAVLWGDNVPWRASHVREGGGAERWVRRQFSGLLLIMCLGLAARAPRRGQRRRLL